MNQRPNEPSALHACGSEGAAENCGVRVSDCAKPTSAYENMQLFVIGLELGKR
jgi:hypothetical protein